MSLSNYPYFINGLKKQIDKEKHFLSKYFILSDLFYSTIKYICFLIEVESSKKIVPIAKLNTASEINPVNKSSFLSAPEYRSILRINIKSESKDILKKLERIIAFDEKNQTFLELKKYLKDNFNFLVKIDKSFIKNEKSTSLNEDKYENLFKNNYIKITELFSYINPLIDFELLIPYSVIKNQTEVFNINGSKITFKEVEKLNGINLESDLIVLKNKSTKKYTVISIFIDSHNKDNKFKSQSIINNFSRYISGSELFKVKITKLNSQNKKIIENENDIYIKREGVSEKLAKFIAEKESGYLFLVGALGTGKSTLVEKFKEDNTNYKIYKTYIKDNVSFKRNLKEIVENIAGKSEENINNAVNSLRFFHKIKSSEKQIVIFEDIHLLEKIDDFLKIFPQKLPSNIYIFFTMAARENIILPMLENRELYYIPSFSYNEVKSLVTKVSNYNNIFNNQLVEEIIKDTYGFPLYIKIYLQDIIQKKDSYYQQKKRQIEDKFINLVSQFEEYTIRFDKKLKHYAKFFFTLLAISKEGMTKGEIVTIFPAISNILIETYIDRSSDFLVKVNGRYKLSSYIFDNICTNQICTKEELFFLNNKIIEFFEPWDKKVSSLSIKHLPYHYLQINDIDKLKKLLLSSFTKSKYKLYPKEILEDLEALIKKIIEDKDNLPDIFNFTFIYQRLKDNGKRELLNILDLTESGKYDYIISKSYDINKSLEKFYQLLIIGSLAADNKKLIESRNAIKKMIGVPNYVIDNNNSEIIFKMCSEILSKGIFDVINLPRSRDDGVNIIKNLKETEYSYKVIEIILKLLESLPNEIDKSVMLEALINRIIDFESLITIEKFYKDIVIIIEKIKNENIRDRLYHVYILCILKKPTIYNAFLNSALEIKERITSSLFKYLYYLSLSLLFLKLKQEKISRDFILKSISFIEDLENLNHLQFMISNLIFALKSYETTYFYEEITRKIFNLIDDISFNFDSLQNKLNLINNFKDSHVYKTELKNIINSVMSLNFFELKNISNDRTKNVNTLQLIKSSVDGLFKIQDKRILNPLLKKLINTFNQKDYLHQIYLYVFILDYLPDREIFDKLVEILNIDLSLDIKIEAVIENISAKNNFSSEITDLIMSKTISLKNTDLSDVIISIINNMDKKEINPGQDFPENIYNICQTIEPVKDKLKVLSHLSYFLVNINQKESGLQLIRKIFSILLNENDQIKYGIIKEILENVGKIKDSFRLYYCLSDVLVNIYNISHYIKDDKVSVKIVQEVFKNTTKLKFSDMKNIFYRTLEIANKTVNANAKMQLINLVRKYLPHISEKNFVIDILQKSVLISEENFSQSDLKLMTMCSLAYSNINGIDYERGKNLFIKLISELSFSSYEEYISQVISFASSLIHKIESKEDSIVFYRLLIEADVYMLNETFILKTYSDVINNITKLADLKLVYQAYSELIKISIRLENSYYKSEYLTKLISGITGFKMNYQSIDLINKIFNLSHFIKDEKDLTHFYKSMIISINKSLSLYTLDDDFKETFKEKINFYLKSMENYAENITDLSTKSELYSLIGLSHYKFNRNENVERGFFKKSIEVINEITENENKIAAETLTALRMIVTNDINGGKSLLEKVTKSIINQKDEKISFSYFEIFYSHKNHISKSTEYRDNLEYMFDSGLNFKSEILNLRKYILAFTYYYENKDINNTYKFIEKSEKILAKDDSYEAIDQKINLGINLLKINQYNKGSDILISIFEEINNKPKRIMYELIIKLFNLISILGESKYKPQLIEKILSEAQKINIREISENDLYSLAYSYANRGILERFKYVYKNIENPFQKEKILETFIESLFVKEDTYSLVELIPLALFSSRIIDKIIAYIALNIEDKELITDLTKTIYVQK